MWKQVVNFNLSKMGHKTGYCLQNVRLGYGIPAKHESALEDMIANRNAGTLHDILTLPLNVDVPVYVDSSNPNEHIIVSVKGKFYSDGVLVNRNNFKYFGWGETVNNVRVVKYEENEMKEYKNGSTKETVYADSNCTQKIGILNPYESCECLGIFENKAIVRYKIDFSNNYKVGFVRWLGGVK